MEKTELNNFADKLFLLLFLLWLMFNVMSRVIVSFFGGIGNVALMYFFCVYAWFFYGKKQNRTIEIYPFLIFLFFYMLIRQFFLSGQDVYMAYGVTLDLEVWNLLLTTPILLTAVAIYEKSNQEMIDWGRKIIITLLIIISLRTIYIVEIDPTVIKWTATGNATFYWGIIEYGLIYSMVMCFPMCLIWANHSKRKIWAYLFIALLLVCLIKTQFLIAIFSLFLSIIIFLIFNIKNKLFRNCLILGILVIATTLIVSGLLAKTLLSIASMVESYEISQRLKEIALFLQTGTMGNTTIRIKMYLDGFIGWLRSPLFGNIIFDSNVTLSEHSTNLDILNGCGAIIFGLYFKFILNVKKANLYEKRSEKAAVVACFITFLFISTVNPIFAVQEILAFYVLGSIFFMGQPQGRSLKNARC